MTALSSLTAPPPIREFTVPPGLYTRQPRGASTTFFPLGLLAQRQGSDLAEHPDPNNPRTDLIVLGCFKANAPFTSGANVDSTGGALDANGNPQSLSIETGVIGWFDTGSGANLITNAMVGTVCFFFDNNTLYATNNNGTLSAAGFVAQVRSDGRVKLRIDPAVYLLGSTPGTSSQSPAGVARAVCTSLGANTGTTTGTLSVTAAGALGAQDGVTLVTGDVLLIPQGTTNLANASDEGPWEVLSAGATGVSAKLARPSWYKTGGPIALAYSVKVGGEGTVYANTTWRASAAKGKVIDTDAANLCPEELIQQVTLVAGTKTISNVPVRSASKVIVTSTLAGGTPAATTTAFQVKLTGGITVGALGTGAVIVEAQSVAGTKVNTDVSVLNVSIRNG